MSHRHPGYSSPSRDSVFALAVPDVTPLDTPTRTARLVNGDVEFEIDPVTGEILAEHPLEVTNMTGAMPLPGFQPIATLTRPCHGVEFQMQDGAIKIGCLILDFNVRLYICRDCLGSYEVEPIAWREIPLPIAHGIAA